MRCEDWKLPYLAGIIDGEGCIYVRVGKIGGRRRTRQYQIVLTITNTSKKLAMWLKNEFDCGNVNVFPREGNRRPAWLAHWSTQCAANILRRVLSYLVIKKNQAKLAIKLADRLKNTKILGGVGKCVDHKEISAREAIRQRMKAFNVRGKIHAQA